MKTALSLFAQAKVCMRETEPQTRIDLFDSLGILCFHGGGWPFPLVSEKFGSFLEAFESCEVKVVFSC